MLKKLNNPFEKYKDHFCFGCSSRNDHGLKMKFYEDGDKIVSEWLPGKEFQGYTTVLHGGIQAAMIDEISSWLVLVKVKTAGVTSSIKVKYQKPVLMNNGKIFLHASLKDFNRKFATIFVKLFDASGKICTEGEVVYFLYDKSDAVEKLRYPGSDAFYDE